VARGAAGVRGRGGRGRLTPARTNACWRVRTEGTALVPEAWIKRTRINPAPQVGCSRLSWQADWTSAWADGEGERPQRE
jgi:hypothetical protein